jgi:ribosomal protein S18 acetylase RimI-like enzyme
MIGQPLDFRLEDPTVPIEIRPATTADAERIADFNARLAAETENKRLDGPTVLAGVRALLECPAHGQYFVAESGGEVAGQLLITYEWSDWRNGQFWWIQSVYVDPRFRRQGVFSQLYRHVATLAGNDDRVCGIRLYVEEHNSRALATYQALGMSTPGYRVMEVSLV